MATLLVTVKALNPEAANVMVPPPNDSVVPATVLRSVIPLFQMPVPVTVMEVFTVLVKMATLVVPLVMSQGVAIVVLQPLLVVSQVMPAFVLVIEAALAVETAPRVRSITSRAERSDWSPKTEA